MAHHWTKLILLAFLPTACSSMNASSQQPIQSAGPKLQTREIVVTYHPAATQIGSDILQSGGNAFDAFVASTAAEYVLGEGVTSFGGPLGALLYDAKTKTSVYLDATFNDPIDSKHKWDIKNPQPGAAVLVPGAIAGLEAISVKYGKIPFKELLAPAIKLAEDGFPLNSLYANLLRSSYGDRLKKNAYALKTFFRDGQPLTQGEILKLPILAQFLKRVATRGSQYAYAGEWAKECLKIVNEQGGHLHAQDFSSYKALWKEPRKISYRGYEIYSPPNEGGLNTLLSLKVLENTDIAKYAHHFSISAEALEIMVRIQQEVAMEPWLHDQEKLNDSKLVDEKFSQEHLSKLWGRVQHKITSAPTPNEGSHSYHIVVIDKDGNAITGTNTIESFPWGNAIFVEGVPLTASGDLPFSTKPGERRKSPLSMQMGFKDGLLRFAVGAFSASLLPAEFQFVTNIVDYRLSALDAVTVPRFGSVAWDIKTRKSSGEIWLDPRVDISIVNALQKRGLKFTQDGYLDTGLGSVAVVSDDGYVAGAIAPFSSVGVHRTKDAGIGAALDLNSKGDVIIQKIYPNSPAAKSGLSVGDVILAIKANPVAKSASTKGTSLKEIVEIIQGPKDSHVGLEVLKTSGETISVDVIRDDISLK